MRRNHTKTSGFTLIELMLAMTFVAFILIFVSLSLVQMFRTYDKGISMKQMNQAGRSLVDDISRSVKSQLPNQIDISGVATGTLCIDKTMYIWNPLYNASGVEVGGTGAHDAVTGDPVSGGMMARKTLAPGTTSCDETSPIDPTQPDTQLLSSRTRVLKSSVQQIDDRLFRLKFVIGTYSRDELVFPSGPAPTRYITPTYNKAADSFSCLPGSDGNYCAFAEFDSVVYTGVNR